MKKGMKKVISALIATSCCASMMAFATACKPVTDPGSQDDPPTCTQHVDEGGDGLCDICGEPMPSDPDDNKPGGDDNKPGGDDDKPGGDDKPDDTKAEWTLSLEKTLDIDIDDEPQKLKYIVLKDNQAVDNADVQVVVTGDAVTYDNATGKISPVKKGDATVTVTLNGTGGDPIVKSQKITVHNYFFSHTLHTDDVDLSAIQDEAATPTVVFSSGRQSAVLVKKKNVKYVFTCKLYLDDSDAVPKGEMFGVGSFLADSKADVNQKALWFGLRNPTTQTTNNPFAQASKNFYGGWAQSEAPSTPQGYDELKISRTGDDDNGIPFVLIRDGADYYYSIDGYYGKRTVNEHKDDATYAGVFSQNIALEVNSFTYADSDAAVAAAIAEYYTDRGIAAIKINESTTTELVKGQQQQYTANAYPADRAQGAQLVWELDKTGLNPEAADGTTISDTGLVTVADNASGSIKVICKTADGSVRSEVSVTVLSESLDNENDFVRVKGGVQITGDNAITFPEAYSHKNGLSDSSNVEANAGDYVETKYCAVLKDNVTKDFTLSFKFGGYKANINTPKFQVSLGANNNNFYLVYTNDRRFHVEAWAKGTRAVAGRDPHKAGWYDSNVIDNFDPNAEHTCEISVNGNGLYTVKIDGVELSFTTDMGANSAVLVRPYDAFTGSLPIKFAAQACSVALTDISVQNGTCELPTFYAENQDNHVTSDTEFTLKMNGPGWGYSNKTQYGDYKLYYTQPLGDSFALDLNATFGKSTADGKFIIGIGDSYIQSNLKKGVLSCCVVKQNDSGDYQWGGEKAETTVSALAEANKFKIRIERKDGMLRVIVNGKLITDTYSSAAGDNDLVFSYFYNDNEADGGDPADLGTTISVTGFALSAWSKAPVYEFGMQSGSVNVVAGGTVTNAIVKHFDGVDSEDDLSYKYTFIGGDEEYYSIDAATGAVTALSTATNYSKVTVKVELVKNGETLYFTTYDVMCAPVSNSYVEVKGGVVLNIPDPEQLDSNWSLTFPEAYKNTDGVGDEQRYEANAYSADLKQKVKGDFRIEFTVDEYANGNGSKLMVSIGGYANQFYIVHGANNRVESFTRGTGNGSQRFFNGANWINSANIGEFSGPETYKIECIGGIYKVYRNGTLLNFYHADDHDENAVATMYRSYEDYYAELPIRISTKGVYCKVSNIVVTDLNDGELNKPTLWSPGRTDITANGFTMTNEVAELNGSVWHWRNSEYYTVYYKEPLDNDSAVEFDAAFSSAMKDGKLGIRLGNLDVHIINKGEGLLKSVFVPNGTDFRDEKPIPVLNEQPYNVKIRLERKDGRVRVIANGALIATIDGYNSGDLSFFFFTANADSDTLPNSVTVSNLSVEGTGFTSQSFYELNASASATTIKPGDATGATITATVFEDAATKTEVTDLAANGLTLEYAVDDTTNFTLTDNKVTANAGLSEVKKATVTVTLKKGETVIATKTLEITATALATQNSVLSVHGGALLNYEGDDPDNNWSVSFDETKDGVVSEEAWSCDDATYSANLFKEVIGDFAIEFTVSDYDNHGENYPKLMLSMGGRNNQFYVVIKRNNDNPAQSTMQIQTYMTSLGSDGVWLNGGQWVNSDEVAIDATVAHTFKVAVENGRYKVWVDNSPVDSFKMDGNARTLLRNPTDYARTLPIRFSVKGATAKVSGIALTGGETAPTKMFTSYNSGKDVIDGDSFTSGYEWSNPMAPDNLGKVVRSMQSFGVGQTAEFTLKFNSKMNDSKFGFIVDNGPKNDWDNHIVWIENKATQGSIIVQKNWGDATQVVGSDGIGDEVAAIKIKAKRYNDGGQNKLTVYLYYGNATQPIEWTHATYNESEAANIYFFGFNGDTSVSDTFTVSNFSVYDNADFKLNEGN